MATNSAWSWQVFCSLRLSPVAPDMAAFRPGCMIRDMSQLQPAASKTKTIAIIHGWAEGNRLSKRLADTLRRRGFTISDNPAAADIVFAHSLGCYLVPSDTKAKVVLLVGVPSGPASLLPVALIRKLAREIAHHRKHKELGWWGKKLAYGAWCAVTKPSNMYYLFARRNLQNLPVGEGRRVVAVRPLHDPFVADNISDIVRQKGYGYREVNGQHDDCWLDPEVYASVIEDESGRA